jgi:U3 small nucleolar RNA-associated protein 22
MCFFCLRVTHGVLQFIYADTMKLFYDPLGGDRIGGVWDPSLKSPRPFRVLGSFSSIPVVKVNFSKAQSKDLGFHRYLQETETIKDHKMVVLNEKAVLGEIERMGKMLVKRITGKK